VLSASSTSSSGLTICYMAVVLKCSSVYRTVAKPSYILNTTAFTTCTRTRSSVEGDTCSYTTHELQSIITAHFNTTILCLVTEKHTLVTAVAVHVALLIVVQCCVNVCLCDEQ
jgi:hypothetical protein